MPEKPLAMKGRVVLITGASSGIGRATALGLAQLGAEVVIAARNPELGEEARREIIARSSNQRVDLLIADLSSQQGVRSLAEQFRQKYQKLHVLINNAGGIFHGSRVTADGVEWTLAVDHLAGFLLTHLLLDTLKHSAPARVINVSSKAHLIGRIDFGDLQGLKKYSSIKAYSQAKLANVLFTYELARRLQGTQVTANCLHPGVVRTQFAKNISPVMRWLWSLFSPFLISAEQGARTSVYLASSPEVENVSGKYFEKEKPAPSSPASYDASIARRLWEVSEEMTGFKTI